MKKRRSADTSGIVVELIQHAGTPFHQKILDSYNGILSSGLVPSDWHFTVFSLLPKSGNLEDALSWRPIAILPVLYKIFARLLYQRIHPILEKEQSDDQFGFRVDRRIDDVFSILENVIGETNEWNLPFVDGEYRLTKSF